MPELMQAAALAYFGATPGRGFLESFMRLTRGLPNGLFDNGAIASYLSRLFSQPGRTDDFRKLGRQLFVVATELDSGKSAPFGAPDSTTCRSPRRSRRARLCPASIRRRGSAIATMSTA